MLTLAPTGSGWEQGNHRWVMGEVLWGAHSPQEYLEKLIAHHSCRVGS